MSQVFRDGGRIVVQGDFRIEDMLRPLASIHQGIERAGYSSLELDFSDCTAAFAGPMLALCSQVLMFQRSGIDFDLKLPSDKKLERLFINTNWAHLMEPRRFAPSQFKGHTHLPVIQFKTAEDQHKAVNRIVNSILGAIPEIDRSDFAALEWSVNELTDNVLLHSESQIGGLVQVSMFQRNRRRIEYIVADAGLGIPRTLRGSHPEIGTDVAALDLAIREGITRDKSVGQGNGLYGSFQICSHSRGFFQVESGYAKLLFNERSGLRVSEEKVPFGGTLIVATIDFSDPGLLKEALRFKGKPYTPIDFIETHYESDDEGKLIFVVRDESDSVGSRVSGAPVREKLKNLLNMCPGMKVFVDFKDIPLISSSFADEVFAKLFVEMGPLSFLQRFEFVNVCTTVQQLIDKAIRQRSAQ